VSDPAGRDAEAAVAAVGLRLLLAVRIVVAVAASGIGLIAGAGSISALVVAALSSVAQLTLVARWLPGTGRRAAFLTVDVAVLLGILALDRGGPAYFAYAASCAAFSGVLLGFRAAPLWTAQLLQGYVVCTVAGQSSELLTTARSAAVAAVPLTGFAAATACRIVLRRRLRSAAEIDAVQRSAAALERARLARELHDSVAKTVRGMSLAALALPRSVGGQPQIARQLADAISAGAAAAERETRALLSGLRLDAPDEDFRLTLERLCRVWSAESGITAELDMSPVDPPVPVRYELARILHESLTNVARHARAERVLIMVRRQDRTLLLVVRDDGAGFAVPSDLSVLQEHNHHGIVGMGERTGAIGGRFEVASEPGRGTIVTVRVPL
jgi:signal transduction histidine kinase